MHVFSIFRPRFISLPPLYQWPKPIKRIMLATATVLCFGIYILLIAGVISLFAIILDLISFKF